MRPPATPDLRFGLDAPSEFNLNFPSGGGFDPSNRVRLPRFQTPPLQSKRLGAKLIVFSGINRNIDRRSTRATKYATASVELDRPKSKRE